MYGWPRPSRAEVGHAAAFYFMVTLIPVIGYRLWRELNDIAPLDPSRTASAHPQLYEAGVRRMGPA